jgi:hypothetical protein
MIAFEIWIDGRKQCVAGIGDLGVASAMATWVRRASLDPTSGEPVPDGVEEELNFEVAGLAYDPDGAAVHSRWLRQPLQLGQQVTLTVVETDEADPPVVREREDPERTERLKRQYYERLKQAYGDA